MKDMDIFHYDKNDTHVSNFKRWWAMNSSEREMYKEKLLSHEEAERLFNSMFGRYRSTQTDT